MFSFLISVLLLDLKCRKKLTSLYLQRSSSYILHK